MIWTDFLLDTVRLDVSYYAIRCRDLSIAAEPHPADDCRFTNLLISGEIVNVDINNRAGSLLDAIIDLGSRIFDECGAASLIEVSELSFVQKKIASLCNDNEYGMLFPTYLDGFVTPNVRKSYELDAAFYNRPRVAGCSLIVIIEKIIQLTLVFKLLLVFRGQNKADKTLIAHVSSWDKSITDGANILRALSFELSGMDFSPYVTYVSDGGMPRAVEIYDSPLDAAFAVCAQVFSLGSAKTARIAVCANCGSPFPQVTVRAKYCSDRCRIAYNRSKKKINEGGKGNEQDETTCK